MRAQVLQPILPLGNGRPVADWDPPQTQVQFQAFKPFAAATHYPQVVAIAIDEAAQRLKALPDGEVDDQLRVVAKATHRHGIAIFGLHPPDEPRGAVGTSVDWIERRHEVGQKRRVERLAGQCDVDLCQIVVAHHSLYTRPADSMAIRSPIRLARSCTSLQR